MCGGERSVADGDDGVFGDGLGEHTDDKLSLTNCFASSRSVGVDGVNGDGLGAYTDDEDEELSLSLTNCFASSCSTLNAKSVITFIMSSILMCSCCCKLFHRTALGVEFGIWHDARIFGVGSRIIGVVGVVGVAIISEATCIVIVNARYRWSADEWPTIGLSGNVLGPGFSSTSDFQVNDWCHRRLPSHQTKIWMR